MPVLAARFTPALDTPHCHQSNVGKILSITGTFMTAAVITVLLRSYVRIKMLKIFGPDDWVMAAACLMAIGTFICFVGESHYGVGRHADCFLLPEMQKMMKWQFYHNLWVMFGTVLVKISIGFFLIRLASKRTWKWFLTGCIIFLVCFGLTCAGTLIFSCVPVAASWNLALRPTATCFSANTFSSIGLMNSIINIITDFLFALIPIPIIMKLQVNTRTKITLGLILSLGLVACAAGIVKAHLQTTFLANQDRYWDDGFMVWAMIELCLGIISASLPSLKPLFKAFFEGTKTVLGLSSSRSKTPSDGPSGVLGSNGSRGYKRQASDGNINAKFRMDGVEFKEVKASSSTSTSSKGGIEVSQDIEMHSLTRPELDEPEQQWDQSWRAEE